MGGYRQCLHAVSRLSVAAGLLVASPPAVLACGYHDDVSMARGMMNWLYPDALHVMGAVSTAVAERRLPAPVSAAAPDLFGSRYRSTAEALEGLGEVLGDTAEQRPASPFSLILIEPMLWTRFDAAGGRLRTRVHVTGPEPGDLVLVSSEAVIGEMAADRLAMAEAIELGLIRLYGTESQKSTFVGSYRAAESGRPKASQSHPAQSAPGHERSMGSVPPAPMSIATRTTPQSTAFEAGGAIACGPGHH